MRTGEQIKFGFFILLTFEFKNVIPWMKVESFKIDVQKTTISSLV